MPETKKEQLVFSILMVLIFVYTMTFFNIGIQNDFKIVNFKIALESMWVEVPIAFLAQRYIATPFVNNMINKHFQNKQIAPIFIIYFIAGITVSVMAPLMTFFVTFLHNGFSSEFLDIWLRSLLINFPFALIAQLFYIGPLVRTIFSKLKKFL